MLKVFDVGCPNGHVTEAWLDGEERETSCPECNEVATRQISSVAVRFDVISGDFPCATDRWLRDRQKKTEKEERNISNHGTPR